MQNETELLDPAAPQNTPIGTDEKDLANFGSSSPTEQINPRTIQRQPGLAPVTIDFNIDAAVDFVSTCMEAGVGYKLGAKAQEGQKPGEFANIDCSGFIRATFWIATDVGSSFPDGSVNQHAWVRRKGFSEVQVEEGGASDGIVRIAFLAPQSTASGIGHVALLHNGQTIESHGGVGPDRRDWTGSGWQGKSNVYVLTSA